MSGLTGCRKMRNWKGSGYEQSETETLPQLGNAQRLSRLGQAPADFDAIQVDALAFPLQIIRRLQIHPEMRGVSKKSRQAQGCVCRNGALAEDDFIDPPARDVDR